MAGIREDAERSRQRAVKSKKTKQEVNFPLPHFVALKSAGISPKRRTLAKAPPEARVAARHGDRGSDDDADADDDSLQHLRKRELAALLKISPYTLDRWRRRGDFPLPLWISPTTPVWRRRDVEQWLGSRQRGGLAPGWTADRTKQRKRAR